MCCAHASPNGKIADCQRADAMHAPRIDKCETLLRLAKDALAFSLGERNVSLIIEALNRTTGIFIAHPTFECHAGAGAGVG